MKTTSFYCKYCELDQEHLPNITTYFGGKHKFIAKCIKCKKELYRLIDEPNLDPFYFLSKYVIINRMKYRKDMIQPGDPLFQIYYKKQYDEMQKQKEEIELKQIKEKKSRDNFYNKFKHNIVERNLAKRILEQEEQLQYGR